MVLFTHKRKVDKFKPIRLFGKELSRSDQVKYLGWVLCWTANSLGRLIWRVNTTRLSQPSFNVGLLAKLGVLLLR